MLKKSAKALLTLFVITSITACGGGGGGTDTGTGAGDGTGTGTETVTGTTRTLTIVDSTFVNFSDISTDYYTGDISAGSTLKVNKNGTPYIDITLLQPAATYCPIQNPYMSWYLDAATLMAVDESNNHYALRCYDGKVYAMYIIDGQGALLWSTTSFDGVTNKDEVYLNSGKVYAFNNNNILASDYVNDQPLTTFHTYQKDSGFSYGRSEPQLSNGYPPVRFLSDGTVFVRYIDFNADSGGMITATKDFYYAVNADGSFNMKFDHDKLTAGLNTITGGEYRLRAEYFGVDSNGKVNLWFPSVADASTGKVVQVAPDEFDLLKAMESPTLSGIPNVLSCEVYATGMCATYAFSNVNDVNYYRSSCSEVASCSTSGAVGICVRGPVDVNSGSGGQSLMHLYLYSSYYDSVSAESTCLGSANGDGWISPVPNPAPVPQI